MVRRLEKTKQIYLLIYIHITNQSISIVSLIKRHLGEFVLYGFINVLHHYS